MEFSEIEYKITATLPTNQSSGSVNKQFLALKGKLGKTEEQECGATFEAGKEITCSITSKVYIGNTVDCVVWRAGGDDGIILDKVINSLLR